MVSNASSTSFSPAIGVPLGDIGREVREGQIEPVEALARAPAVQNGDAGAAGRGGPVPLAKDDLEMPLRLSPFLLEKP